MALPQILTRLLGRTKAVLPIQASAGVGDAEKLIATDAAGKIDLSLLPSGTGPSNKVIATSEALAANDMVNLFDDAGDIKARKADANSAGKECMGFTKAAVLIGDPATVYFAGELTGLAGLTPGSYQWLSDDAGLITEVPPSGAGVLSQIVGVATSDTTMEFQLERGGVLLAA